MSKIKKINPGYFLIIIAMVFSLINNFKLLAGFSSSTQMIVTFISLPILFGLMILSLYYNSEHNYKKYFLIMEIFLIFIGLGIALLIENFNLFAIAMFCLSSLFIINIIVNRFLPRQDSVVIDR